MGLRGPQPTPPAFRVLQGGRDRFAESIVDGRAHPVVEIPKPPKNLSPEARREWKRLAPRLEQLGLVSELDRSLLASWARLNAVNEALEQRWAERVDELVAGGLGYASAVERVEIEAMPSGYKQQSALSSRMRAAREELRAIGDRFGLSPAARARVVASQRYEQPTLPGIDDPVGEKLAALRGCDTWANFR